MEHGVITSTLSKQIQSYLRQGKVCRSKGKYCYALNYYCRALGLAEVLNRAELLLEIRLTVLEIYHYLRYQQLAIEMADVILQSDLEIATEAIVLDYKLRNMIHSGRFTETKGCLQKLKLRSNPMIQRIAYTNQGLLDIYLFRFLQKNTLERSQKVLKKAYHLAETEENQTACQQILYYLALSLIEEGLVYNARERLLEALTEMDDLHFKIIILNELGNTSFRLFEHDLALKYLNQAKTLTLEHAFCSGLQYNYFYRGQLYMDQLDDEKAHKYLFIALHDFLAYNQTLDVIQVCWVMSQLFNDTSCEKKRFYLQRYEYYRQMIPDLADEDCSFSHAINE